MILPLLMCLCVLPQDGDTQLPEVTVTGARVSSEPLVVCVRQIGDLTGYEQSSHLLSDLHTTHDAAEVQVTLAKLERHAWLSRQVDLRTEGLVDAIETFMRPPLAGGDQRLEYLGDGRLVMVGTQEQQRWLTEFLQGAAAHEGQILIEARVVEMPLTSLEILGLQEPRTTLGVAAMADLDLRIGQLEAKVLTVPRVATLPFSKASLFVGKEHAYIKDYELQILDGVSIADPVISVVQDGVSIDLRSVPMSDGRLAVDVQLRLAEVVEPIAEFETSLGGASSTVTIQLPEVHQIRASTTAYLRATDSAVLATVDPEGKREYLIIFSARQIDASDTPPEPPADYERR